MEQFDAAHTFALDRDAAFAYITNPDYFGLYWPGMREIRRIQGNWTTPGDKLEIDMHIVGRQRTINMELLHFTPPYRLVYKSRQKGLPDTVHERHFATDGHHCRYRIVMQFEPRRGVTGLFDKYVAQYFVRRVLSVTLNNLDRVFAEQGEDSTEAAS